MDAKIVLILLVALFAMIGQSHQEGKMSYKIEFLFNKTTNLNETYLKSKFMTKFGSNIRNVFIEHKEKNQSQAIIETSVPFDSVPLTNKMCNPENHGVLVLDGFLDIADLSINKINCTRFNLPDDSSLIKKNITIVANSDNRVQLSQFLFNFVILAGYVGWSMSKIN